MSLDSAVDLRYDTKRISSKRLNYIYFIESKKKKKKVLYIKKHYQRIGESISKSFIKNM